MKDADRSGPARNGSHGRPARDGASLPERVLWAMLRDRRFRGRGLKFRRRGHAAGRPASFVCEEAELVVRLDEQRQPHATHSHDGEARPAPWPNRPGQRVVHVTTTDLLYMPEAVATAIAREAGVE